MMMMKPHFYAPKKKERKRNFPAADATQQTSIKLIYIALQRWNPTTKSAALFNVAENWKRAKSLITLEED